MRPDELAAELLADEDDLALDADAPTADLAVRIVEVGEDHAGQRIDKTLAVLLPELSRGRVQALMAAGLVTFRDQPVTDASGKIQVGDYHLTIPMVTTSGLPQSEAIPLTVLFEDQYLIVVDKPAGMAAHPGPGTESGTLVNALLHHCGSTLSGIGGVARPGIVHRLDKDTSGVMVAAKTDAAHQGLSKLFAEHDIERSYIALTRNAPHPNKGTITTQIGRSKHDRKKMAILRVGGREAITHYRVARAYGSHEKPMAARVVCKLETGRTHQIRVHLASKGAPCLGDQTYGSGSPATPVKTAMAEAGLTRQALHAAVLGFVHPITGETLRFETPLPEDMARLEERLEAL
ncbi:MAG: pseudouridine synthase [Caulobacter sp.]|nr:pseudouridine synthase [Caulobacter sp.]